MNGNLLIHNHRRSLAVLCYAQAESDQQKLAERMGFEPIRNEASAEAARSVAAKLIKTTPHSRSRSAALPVAYLLADFAEAIIELKQDATPPRRRQLKEILKHKSWLRSRVHGKGS
jgi:hypothetical protein